MEYVGSYCFVSVRGRVMTLSSIGVPSIENVPVAVPVAVAFPVYGFAAVPPPAMVAVTLPVIVTVQTQDPEVPVVVPVKLPA